MSTTVSPLRVPMLTAAIDDETTSIPVRVVGYGAIAIDVIGTGTTSSGVLTIEEASWDKSTALPYGGTWSPIITVNASDVTGGAQKTVHLPYGAYNYLRTRVSTAIGGGGSVSTVLRGNP